jgi:hypothetical protein
MRGLNWRPWDDLSADYAVTQKNRISHKEAQKAQKQSDSFCASFSSYGRILFSA